MSVYIYKDQIAVDSLILPRNIKISTVSMCQLPQFDPTELSFVGLEKIEKMGTHHRIDPFLLSFLLTAKPLVSTSTLSFGWPRAVGS